MSHPQRLSISPPMTASTPRPIWTDTTRVLTGSTSTPVLEDDANVLRYTDAVTIDELEVTFDGEYAFQPKLLLGVTEHAFPAEPPARGNNFDISGSRIAAYAPGKCTIAVYDYGSKTSQLYAWESKLSSPTTSSDFVSWDTGSTAAVTAAWSVANDATIQKSLWTTYSPSTNTFLYNNSSLNGATSGGCQALVAWNSDTNSRAKGGVLISPEHVAFTAHWKPSVGCVLKFVETNGTVHSRTVQSVFNVPGSFDGAVALLSQPLTAIEPMKVISPADRATKMPSIFKDSLTLGNHNVPVYLVNRLGEVRSLLWHFGNGSAGYRKASSDANYAYLANPSGDAVVGDSGSPVMASINGVLTLISLTTNTAWQGGGPSVGGDYDSILSQRGRSLSYIDLSSYNTY